MILAPPITKQVNETFLVSVEFARRFKPTEAITAVTITAKKVLDGSDSTSAIVSGPTFAGSIAQCRLPAAGAQVAGEDHIVQVRAMTSLGNTFEAEIALAIREE